VGDKGAFFGDLVEDEEWEIYYNRAQLNKDVWDRHVRSPLKVQAAAQLLVNVLTKEILTTTNGTSSTHSGAGCQLSLTIARTSPSSARPQLSRA
jgi:hypothetical protein